MVCIPWSALVERVAVELLMAAVPRVVPPSRKVTVPVGAGTADGGGEGGAGVRNLESNNDG